MSGLAADDKGWTPLFDGKTLDGWEVHGGIAKYKVEDGTIVGTTVEGSSNTFLCKGDFKDFVLEVEVQCDPRLNSGVQVRSHVYQEDGPDPLDPKKHRTKGVVYGPQCEIARHETGTAGRFYDESRRDKWICEITNEGKDAFKDTGWNHYKVVVQGEPVPLMGQRQALLPTSPTTSISTASSASRSTASARKKAPTRCAGGTSGSRRSSRERRSRALIDARS